MKTDIHATSAAVLLVLAGCQPLVVSPIGNDPASVGGTSTSSSSTSGAMGTGGGAPIGCGAGIPAHPAITLTPTSDLGVYLAVDATSIYWVGTHVWKLPKSGGTPVALAPPPTGTSPFRILVAADNVYWGDNDGVHVIPAGGGTPVLIDGSYGYGLAVDAANLYWTTKDRVMKAPLGGGAPTQITSLTYPGGNIAVDATRAYWDSQIGPIQSAPLAGGPVVTLAPLQGTKIYGLAVGGGQVYWGGINMGLGSLPVGGGTVTYRGTTAAGVVVDGGDVYWADPALGAVCKMALGGGDATTLAAGEQVPFHLAVDDTDVYWSDQTGIRKTAK